MTYAEFDGSILVKLTDKSIEEFSVPEGVTEIGENAFYFCRAIKKITLPPTLEHIGKFAFSGCMKLRKISLPSSVKTIGKAAFNGCQNLEEIQLPDTIQKIEDFTFGGCGKLKEITLPKSLEFIGDYAFKACYCLQEIKLPLSVKHIGEESFAKCMRLTDFKMPVSMESIGDYPFGECEFDRYIAYDDTHLSWIDLYDSQGVQYILPVYNSYRGIFPSISYEESFEKFKEYEEFDRNSAKTESALLRMKLKPEEKYILYLKKWESWVLKQLLDEERLEELAICCEYGIFSKESISYMIDRLNGQEKPEFKAILLDYQHKHYGSFDSDLSLEDL